MPVQILLFCFNFATIFVVCSSTEGALVRGEAWNSVKYSANRFFSYLVLRKSSIAFYVWIAFLAAMVYFLVVCSCLLFSLTLNPWSFAPLPFALAIIYLIKNEIQLYRNGVWAKDSPAQNNTSKINKSNIKVVCPKCFESFKIKDPGIKNDDWETFTAPCIKCGKNFPVYLCLDEDDPLAPT